MSSSKFTKSVFNVEWTDSQRFPHWYFWIREVPSNPYAAHCILCHKTFSLSNMGRQAVTSHEQCAKHQKNLKARSQSSVLNFMKKPVPETATLADVKSDQPARSQQVLSVPTASKEPSLPAYVLNETALKAEIIWAMKLVHSHSSLNSFDDAGSIFAHMFPDSEVAKKCTLGRSKMAYLISFGLAPYFHLKLEKEMKDQKFVICFDEALNRVSQRCQMDIVLRYWSNMHNQVKTRYWISVFMGHATAEILMQKLIEGISGLNLKHLIQISMDGPNVNLKFLRNMKEHLHEEYDCSILDLGTCGLHIVHGAFQYGHKMTGWGLNALLRAIYVLFKDSPARRADYIQITESSVFPLKFCQVRWVENAAVSERAVNIFSDIKKYVESIKSLPCTVSCEVVEKACNDSLILAKLSFFSYLANLLEPFLRRFQTPKPMSPFLYAAFSDLIRQLMRSFIKNEVLDGAITLQKLFQIDIEDRKNHKRNADIDIGIAAIGFLNKSKTSDLQKQEFRLSCAKFLRETTKKIINRTSASFSCLKAISCLDPKLLRQNPVLCVKRMSTLLQLLHQKNIVPAATADKAKQQFDLLAERAKGQFKENFTAFSESNCSLDTFYGDLLKGDDCFLDVWHVIKIVLILSHGNAPVESGFSVNKDMLVENLHENSLIGLRTVYDEVKNQGGILNVPITSELIGYAKSSRSRYHHSLEEKKQNAARAVAQDINKRKINDQIKILQQKKNKVAHEAHLETSRINQQIAELSKHE